MARKRRERTINHTHRCPRSLQFQTSVPIMGWMGGWKHGRGSSVCVCVCVCPRSFHLRALHPLGGWEKPSCSSTQDNSSFHSWCILPSHHNPPPTRTPNPPALRAPTWHAFCPPIASTPPKRPWPHPQPPIPSPTTSDTKLWASNTRALLCAPPKPPSHHPHLSPEPTTACIQPLSASWCEGDEATHPGPPAHPSHPTAQGACAHTHCCGPLALKHPLDPPKGTPTTTSAHQPTHPSTHPLPSARKPGQKGGAYPSFLFASASLRIKAPTQAPSTKQASKQQGPSPAPQATTPRRRDL